MKLTLTTTVFAALITNFAAADSTITVTDPSVFAAATGTTAADTSFDQATIGTGSWQANGAAKSSIWFTPDALGFTSTITISDVQEMSFKTYKSTTGVSAPDWYLTVYTAPTGQSESDNGSTWYGVRMTWEGLYANNFSNPADQWNTFTTSAGTNQLTMHDSNTTYTGFYGGPTLATIQANAGVINWSTYATSGSTATFDYDNSAIIGFVLETGSGWANGFDGYLDEFSVTVGGETTTVNFDPVPEPTSLAMLGLGGLVVLRRRRQS